MTLSPSRSHCTAAPAINTAPSRQYVVRLPSFHPTVVNRPFADKAGLSPVLSKRKQPVPYVFFADPGSRQSCPNSAACWSPTADPMGIDSPSNSRVVWPYPSLELLGESI